MWICGYTNSEACVPSGNYRMLEVNQRGNDEEDLCSPLAYTELKIIYFMSFHLNEEYFEKKKKNFK